MCDPGVIGELISNVVFEIEAAAVEGRVEKLENVDWLVPHQANIRIINTTVSILKFDINKTIVNIEKYGNTSSATIPVAFHEAIMENKIKRGQTVVFSAFGAGLTSGSIVFKY